MNDLFGDVIPEKEVYEEEKESHIFDYLNAITYKKKDIIGDDPVAEKFYIPYSINKALSQNLDCILYVNEMNFRPSTDKKLQFDYLINNIRKRFRKAEKWLTFESSDIDCIKEYYNYSDEKARRVLNIFPADELAMIREIIEKGGLVK